MDNMKPLNPIQKTVVGVQFLFVAFGATVLVPLLVGLDPSTAPFYCWYRHVDLSFGDERESSYFFWEAVSLLWRLS